MGVPARKAAMRFRKRISKKMMTATTTIAAISPAFDEPPLDGFDAALVGKDIVSVGMGAVVGVGVIDLEVADEEVTGGDEVYTKFCRSM